MTKYKKILILAFIAVFVGTFSIALLGAIGRVPLAEGSLGGFFVALGIELVAVVVAAFRTRDFFKDDPEDIASVKRQAVADAARVAENQKKEVAELRMENDRLRAEIESLTYKPNLADLQLADPESIKKRE